MKENLAKIYCIMSELKAIEAQITMLNDKKERLQVELEDLTIDGNGDEKVEGGSSLHKALEATVAEIAGRGRRDSFKMFMEVYSMTDLTVKQAKYILDNRDWFETQFKIFLKRMA